MNYKLMIFDDIENTKTKEIKRKLKYESSFAKNFNQLRESIILEGDQGEPNSFYCHEFIEILFDKFLSYAFIWASFVQRDLPNDIKSIDLSNGPIETYIKNRDLFKVKPVYPDMYVMDTYEYPLLLHLKNGNSNIIKSKMKLD